MLALYLYKGADGFPSERVSDAELWHIPFLHKLLHKQSSCWWFETPWCLYDVTIMDEGIFFSPHLRNKRDPNTMSRSRCRHGDDALCPARSHLHPWCWLGPFHAQGGFRYGSALLMAPPDRLLVGWSDGRSCHLAPNWAARQTFQQDLRQLPRDQAQLGMCICPTDLRDSFTDRYGVSSLCRLELYYRCMVFFNSFTWITLK